MCRNQTVMSLLYIKSFRCVVLTIIKNTLQFFFCLCSPSISHPTHSRCLSTPGERAGCGGEGGQRGPSVYCFILCLIKTVRLCSRRGLRAKWKWNVHMCELSISHYSTKAAVCLLNYAWIIILQLVSLLWLSQGFLYILKSPSDLPHHPPFALFLSFLITSSSFPPFFDSCRLPLSCCFPSFHLDSVWFWSFAASANCRGQGRNFPFSPAHARIDRLVKFGSI